MKSRFKTHFLPTKQHAGNKIPSLVLIFFVVVVGCTSTHVGMGDVQRWEQEGNLQQLKAQQYKGSKQTNAANKEAQRRLVSKALDSRKINSVSVSWKVMRWLNTYRVIYGNRWQDYETITKSVDASLHEQLVADLADVIKARKLWQPDGSGVDLHVLVYDGASHDAIPLFTSGTGPGSEPLRSNEHSQHPSYPWMQYTLTWHGPWIKQAGHRSIHVSLAIDGVEGLALSSQQADLTQELEATCGKLLPPVE